MLLSSLASDGDRDAPTLEPRKPVGAPFYAAVPPCLVKGPACPLSSSGEERRKAASLGSDQQHRRCPGRGKYAALIFNGAFPFSPNKLSATAGRADLFCQQWKYFKYDACHWVTQNPSHTQKNTHTAEASRGRIFWT